MTTPHSEIPGHWLQDKAPPLVLDLGCHRGQFLVALAQQHPEWNVLGVERLGERVERCLRKIQRLGLTNAHALRAEVREFVEGLTAGTVRQAHILFPDPWPKRRHASRRLLQPDFLKAIIAALAPGGALRILTDQPSYAHQVRQAILDFPCLVASCEPEFPRTAFEEKFLSRGLAVERLYWLKLAATRQLEGATDSEKSGSAH